MAVEPARIKAPVAKFSMCQLVRHLTGVEGYVHDIKGQMAVQHPNGSREIHNLPECVYVMAYTDKNGVVQMLQVGEMFLSAVK